MRKKLCSSLSFAVSLCVCVKIQICHYRYMNEGITIFSWSNHVSFSSTQLSLPALRSLTLISLIFFFQTSIHSSKMTEILISYIAVTKIPSMIIKWWSLDLITSAWRSAIILHNNTAIFCQCLEQNINVT